MSTSKLCRKYGYKAAKEERNIKSKRQLNAKTILMSTELNKHRPHLGKTFNVPLGTVLVLYNCVTY